MADNERAVMEAAESCYYDVISQPYPNDSQLYCNATWDTWGCWNYTLAGTRKYIACPPYLPGFDSSRVATKDCNEDGTWWISPLSNKSWANYTTCIDTSSLALGQKTIYLFIAGYTISIAALIVSLFIFIYFRQLQCDRVTLHKHLFVSYILNSVAWILYYSLAALNADVLLNNPEWCRALHVLTQYFVGCNFFWMFCEGFYLHTIIVVAFTTGKKLLISCIIIGWALPVVPTIIYTIFRATDEISNERCWLAMGHLTWIVFGPIVVTLLLNLIFLCNIIRVLITKLRAVNSPDANQTKKAVRAILILIPLLGLQYILFSLQPDNPPVKNIYLIISAFVTSFQGLFVALIFCFFNGEVISVIKRKWGQHRLMRGTGGGMVGGTRSTLFSQTTISVAENTNIHNQQRRVSPPKSPRLYENRCQDPGGKPHKPIAKLAPFRIVRNGQQQGEQQYRLADCESSPEDISVL